MIHTDIEIGKVYEHKLDGIPWQVRITSVFEDRQRWGWEGTVVNSDYRDRVEIGSPCWGWISELTKVKE